MWDLRRQVSLLLENGHAEAPFYPVGMVSDEVSLVLTRSNHAEATRAVLLQMAVSGVLDKKAGELFQATIKKLTKE